MACADDGRPKTFPNEVKAPEDTEVVQSKKQVDSFLDLPYELRENVYLELIAAGELGCLTTCKLVKEELTPLIPKLIFRVDLGFANGTRTGDLAPGAEKSIQRLKLHIHTGEEALPFDIDVIKLFAGTRVVRESCVVTLDYGVEGLPPYYLEHSPLYHCLAALTGFKTVVVKIVVGRRTFGEIEGLLTEADFLRIFKYDSNALSRSHKRSYSKVHRFLRRTLGPGMFHDSVEGHCLVFHPGAIPTWCAHASGFGPDSEGDGDVFDDFGSLGV